MADRTYRVEVVPRAARDLDGLPAKVASACVAFMFSSLASDPNQVSYAPTRELSGFRSSRRGAYRIIFRIDDDTQLIEVVRVSHRARAYRT